MPITMSSSASNHPAGSTASQISRSLSMTTESDSMTTEPDVFERTASRTEEGRNPQRNPEPLEIEFPNQNFNLNNRENQDQLSITPESIETVPSTKGLIARTLYAVTLFLAGGGFLYNGVKTCNDAIENEDDSTKKLLTAFGIISMLSGYVAMGSGTLNGLETGRLFIKKRQQEIRLRESQSNA